jgi:hypothetical protein
MPMTERALPALFSRGSIGAMFFIKPDFASAVVVRE